jgi:DNA-3-methyladenine glycosylase
LRAGLARPPEEAALFLLGQHLVRRVGGRTLVVRLVETEAYLGRTDPAAHASHGRTPRTAPLWGPPGTIYVYLIYGMYHCLNVSAQGEGGCVLIRGAEVLTDRLPPLSCRGPGRLCRTLKIDTRESGMHLFSPRSRLYLREGTPPLRIGISTRVGIRHAAERPLRFFDADSPAVSR